MMLNKENLLTWYSNFIIVILYSKRVPFYFKVVLVS